MATASKADVKRVLNGTDLSDSDIDAFLSAASAKYSDALGDESVDSNTLLAEIEAHLAAALIRASAERQVDDASEGDGSISRSANAGDGWKLTNPGHTAIALDPEDVLADGDGGGGGNDFTVSP